MLLTLQILFLQMFEREEEAGHWPQSGDEHLVQVLVLLPQGEFQQEDVCRVQKLCMGGCCQWIQVWVGVPVQVLQLWTGEEVQARSVQRLPDRDNEGL